MLLLCRCYCLFVKEQHVERTIGRLAANRSEWVIRDMMCIRYLLSSRSRLIAILGLRRNRTGSLAIYCLPISPAWVILILR